MQAASSWIDPIRLLASVSEEARYGWILLLSTLPYSVNSPDTIAELFRERIAPYKKEHPLWAWPIFAAGDHPLILAGMLRLGMRHFSKRFIAGNGYREIRSALHRISAKKCYFNIDIIGEAVRGEKEADRYQAAYIELIETLSREMPYGSLSVSLKPTSFFSQISELSPEKSVTQIFSRVVPILDLLQKNGGHAYFDAEFYKYLLIQFQVFKTAYARYGSTARFVFQSYLADDDPAFQLSQNIFNELILLNDPADPVRVRLVRGAYWFLECFDAEIKGWKKPPVFTTKQKTDVRYEELLLKGLNKGLRMAVATHNADSISFATKCSLGIGRPIEEIQVLFGVGNPIALILSSKGWRVRIYMPVTFPRGPLTEQLPYMIRRIDESQMSMIMQSSGPELEQILKRLNDIPERRGD